jgi:hypothetical protein
LRSCARLRLEAIGVVLPRRYGGGAAMQLRMY